MKTEERFWAKVDVRGPDDCWPWTAGKIRCGYGSIRVGARSVLAHRLAWELVHGPIPSGLNVCHSCDNPPCCNPTHLFLGTQRDNIQDATRKGRMFVPDTRGQRNGRARLTVGDVLAIRSGGESLRVAARRLGVTPQAVASIRHRRTWGWVE